MPRRAQQPVRHHAHGAALADDADRPVGRRRLDEHRGEARDRAGAEVGQALRVRPEHPHAAGPRGLDHRALLRARGGHPRSRRSPNSSRWRPARRRARRSRPPRTASAPGVATIASSGTSGSADSDAYERSPWISSRVGLTGNTGPLKPNRFRNAIGRPPILSALSEAPITAIERGSSATRSVARVSWVMARQDPAGA